MKRVVIPELLDSDAGSPTEIGASLNDLRHINRWFGGVSTTCRMIERVADATGRKQFSLLEVASGAGDLPSDARARLKSRGIEIGITLLDRAASHLRNGFPKVVADAVAL